MIAASNLNDSCCLAACINPPTNRGKAFKVFCLVAAAGGFIALGATLVFSWPVALVGMGICLLVALVQLGRCQCSESDSKNVDENVVRLKKEAQLDAAAKFKEAVDGYRTSSCSGVGPVDDNPTVEKLAAIDDIFLFEEMYDNGHQIKLYQHADSRRVYSYRNGLVDRCQPTLTSLSSNFSYQFCNKNWERFGKNPFVTKSGDGGLFFESELESL